MSAVVIPGASPEGVAAKPAAQGLYDPRFEHDACGVGFVAHVKGKRSHSIIEQGLKILDNLSHRGATGYDPLLGDGAGILVQLPDAHLRRVCGKQGMTLPALGQYGVGMVFLPREPASRMACEQEIERAIDAEGQILLGWRDVPTDNNGLSQATIAVEPLIRQVFVARGVRPAWSVVRRAESGGEWSERWARTVLKPRDGHDTVPVIPCHREKHTPHLRPSVFVPPSSSLLAARHKIQARTGIPAAGEKNPRCPLAESVPGL